MNDKPATEEVDAADDDTDEVYVNCNCDGECDIDLIEPVEPPKGV
jgi:hypothetical protein